MGVSVNLDTGLVKAARSYSVVESRSVPKQIEHWAKIGRISEENPDLSYSVIKDMLLGMADVNNDDLDEYVPGSF